MTNDVYQRLLKILCEHVDTKRAEEVLLRLLEKYGLHQGRLTPDEVRKIHPAIIGGMSFFIQDPVKKIEFKHKIENFY